MPDLSSLGGGGATGDPSEREAKQKAVEEQRKELLAQVLTPEALERRTWTGSVATWRFVCSMHSGAVALPLASCSEPGVYCEARSWSTSGQPCHWVGTKRETEGPGGRAVAYCDAGGACRGPEEACQSEGAYKLSCRVWSGLLGGGVQHAHSAVGHSPCRSIVGRAWTLTTKRTMTTFDL
jgi:hypothetical protein